MTVINTSPAIHLHAVLPGGLGVLPGVIGEIIVPLEAGQELAAGNAKDSAWREIQRLPGIHHRTKAVAIHPLISAQIDLGEAAVIQTALDEALDAVILDDLKARRVALTLGLQVTGTDRIRAPRSRPVRWHEVALQSAPTFRSATFRCIS